MEATTATQPAPGQALPPALASPQGHNFSPLGPETARSTNIYRPIQYLGSKLRSLDAILSLRQRLFDQPVTVLDPFVGSTVVAQAFSLQGDTVICSDALSFCNHIATAVLGIGLADPAGTAERAKCLTDHNHNLALELFQSWIDLEDSALKARDSQSLIELSLRLPQVWRAQDATARMRRHFQHLSNSPFHSLTGADAIIPSFYAGTYFGIRQAIELDTLWHAIFSERESGQLTPWQFSVLLAALCSASSACVFSAGKHFAQPYLSNPSKTTPFAHKRILDDRSVSVKNVFQSTVEQIVSVAQAHHGSHRVLWSTLESLRSKLGGHDRVDLVYADPPYTAQQYSRFYHILETFARGQIPDIQTTKGSPTTGIYPTNRHKSPFCSKTAAPSAFGELLSTATYLQSSVLLSYSFSGHRTGNDRMVTLDDILSLPQVKDGFTATIHEFDHEFRNFNSTEIEGASDKEFLIFLKLNASKIPRQ